VPTIDDEALVLDHHPFRDRDLVLSVLTHTRGVQRGVLRRARGGKAPPAAAAQILSLVHVGLYQRPDADLATFRHLDLITSSYPLSRELDRSAAAAVVAELLLTFCPPAEPVERAFRLGVACLEGQLDGVAPATVVTYAEYWSLVLGGVIPAVESIETALGHEGAIILAAYRRQPVSKLADTAPPVVSSWLDQSVRDEAERPLRALEFYRKQVG
jgi:recombinational DNA repair protein (RecF pathway)